MVNFIKHLESNTFDAEYMKDVHHWIMKHTQDRNNILPIRGTGRVDGRLCKELRARRIDLITSGSTVVFSDNELAVWLYLNAHRYFKNKSFNDLLLEKIMPVADSRAKRESDGQFKLESVKRPWSKTIHSHVFDAGLYRTLDASLACREEIVSRFLRLAHPLNHFLFPKGISARAEQNGNPKFQFVTAVYMKKLYPDQFGEFIEGVKPNVHFTWDKDWEVIGNANESLIFDMENPQVIIHPVKQKLKGARTMARLNLRFNIKELPDIEYEVCNSRRETVDKVRLARKLYSEGQTPEQIMPHLGVDIIRTKELITGVNWYSEERIHKIIGGLE